MNFRLNENPDISESQTTSYLFDWRNLKLLFIIRWEIFKRCVWICLLKLKKAKSAIYTRDKRPE